MIGLLLLAGGGGRLGSCGLRSGGSRMLGLEEKARDFGLGEGAQALGFRTRGRKAGGGGGKPLEALFPPAVKGRRQKGFILYPIFTTTFL